MNEDLTFDETLLQTWWPRGGSNFRLRCAFRHGVVLTYFHGYVVSLSHRPIPVPLEKTRQSLKLRLGYVCSMQKDGFWKKDGWVIFPKKSVKFLQMDGFGAPKSLNFGRSRIFQLRLENPWVDGGVLSTKFWQIDGFENRNWYFDGLVGRWVLRKINWQIYGFEQKVLIDGRVCRPNPKSSIYPKYQVPLGFQIAFSTNLLSQKFLSPRGTSKLSPGTLFFNFPTNFSPAVRYLRRRASFPHGGFQRERVQTPEAFLKKNGLSPHPWGGGRKRNAKSEFLSVFCFVILGLYTLLARMNGAR